MNIERLEIMATILDEVEANTWQRTVPFHSAIQLVTDDAPVRFDMESWGTLDSATEDNVCGFSACAVGHAILDDRLSELRSVDHPLALIPAYEGAVCWEAVKAYFDLTEDQAERVFDSHSYINSDGVRAIQVATRIRALTGGYWS